MYLYVQLNNFDIFKLRRMQITKNYNNSWSVIKQILKLMKKAVNDIVTTNSTEFFNISKVMS